MSRIELPQWFKDTVADLRAQGYTANGKVDPPTPIEPPKEVDMSKFIPRPRTIEAAKWDGSPEGAAEIKALLAQANYTMDSFTVTYDSQGKLDKRNSKIIYYRGTGDVPSKDDRYKWREYSLSDGWMVWDRPGIDLKTMSDEAFKRDYFELGQVDFDTFTDWFGSAT